MNFPTLSCTSTSETRTLSTSKAGKWYPFWVEPPHLGHYRECTSPGSPPWAPPGLPHQAHPLLLYNNILCENMSNKKKKILAPWWYFIKRFKCWGTNDLILTARWIYQSALIYATLIFFKKLFHYDSQVNLQSALIYTLSMYVLYCLLSGW